MLLKRLNYKKISKIAIVFSCRYFKRKFYNTIVRIMLNGYCVLNCNALKSLFVLNNGFYLINNQFANFAASSLIAYIAQIFNPNTESRRKSENGQLINASPGN